MSADIINLRLARKRKDRESREAEALRNRTLHGRSKGEKVRIAREKARADRSLDGHLRDGDES